MEKSGCELINSLNYSKFTDGSLDKIALLTLGGSHAYGLNTETSDIDVRGVFEPSRQCLLGYGKERSYHFRDDANDVTIQSFEKTIKLFVKCNPEVIEILGHSSTIDYAIISDVGAYMLENYHIFLSQQAFISFGGYAKHQLNRIKSALAKDTMTEKEQQLFVIEAIERCYRHLSEKYPTFSPDMLQLDTCDEGPLKISLNMKRIESQDFTGIYNEIMPIIKNYNNYIGHRNRKKDSMHLNKHAMHLVRVLIEGTELLRYGEINTYRGKDRSMLMDIRNGKYQTGEMQYSAEFFKLVDELESDLNIAKEKSVLPENVDMAKIDKFVTRCNEMILGL